MLKGEKATAHLCRLEGVAKAAKAVDAWVWVGMKSIRHLTTRPQDAAAFGRTLFNLRAALRKLELEED